MVKNWYWYEPPGLAPTPRTSHFAPRTWEQSTHLWAVAHHLWHRTWLPRDEGVPSTTST